ncbi:MAG: hypothetical protein OEM46_09365 [Ignavibacteria bacterium]|nr:hypothetical protein [Ignavibacteria bacterium]
MNSKKFFFVLFAFVGLLLVSCSDEQQSPVTPTDPSSLGKDIIREFTGTEEPLAITDPGTITVHNGITMLRNMHQNVAFQVTFSDGGIDILSGEGDLELNANIDVVNGTSFWWGNKTLTPSDPEALGGQFKFTWHGPGTLGPAGWTLTFQEVGHGEGGALTGIQCFNDILVTASPNLSTWIGDAEGYLKTH